MSSTQPDKIIAGNGPEHQNLQDTCFSTLRKDVCLFSLFQSLSQSLYFLTPLSLNLSLGLSFFLSQSLSLSLSLSLPTSLSLSNSFSFNLSHSLDLFLSVSIVNKRACSREDPGRNKVGLGASACRFFEDQCGPHNILSLHKFLLFSSEAGPSRYGPHRFKRSGSSSYLPCVRTHHQKSRMN